MTDTATATKAPPAWMKREPLTRIMAAAQVAAEAREISKHAAERSIDRDVSSGLEAQSKTLARAAGCLTRNEPLDAPTAMHMAEIRDARLGCARAATDSHVRAIYMDRAHAISEALRHAGVARVTRA